jgi:DNA-binding response OmpR family regulator
MEAHAQPAHARTVLVVDDDAATRTFEEDLLRLAGYAVRKAASGGAALMHVAAAPIDAIVLDYWLPGSGGMTMCRRLREYIAADVPIIMVTADHTVGLEDLARNAGATGFLRKPFLAAELLEQLPPPT